MKVGFILAFHRKGSAWRSEFLFSSRMDLFMLDMGLESGRSRHRRQTTVNSATPRRLDETKGSPTLKPAELGCEACARGPRHFESATNSGKPSGLWSSACHHARYHPPRWLNTLAALPLHLSGLSIIRETEETPAVAADLFLHSIPSGHYHLPITSCCLLLPPLPSPVVPRIISLSEFPAPPPSHAPHHSSITLSYTCP
ncbi:hypothetical protein VTI74DRAFT_7296 [Chaetomium olivicolor]